MLLYETILCLIRAEQTGKRKKEKEKNRVRGLKKPMHPDAMS